MIKKILFLFLTSVFFVLPPIALAKDYSIPEVSIEVFLQKDGSAVIKESRTYSFDGSFSWADEWINLSAKCSGCANYQIEDFSLSDEGGVFVESDLEMPSTYQVTLTRDRFYVKWFYSAANQEKTFVLEYRIKNAITNHKDISEFYWQLVGNEWEKGIEDIDAKVYLPDQAPDDKIWAFGHGPLNGKINIVSNREIIFSASGLPPKTFFEVRVLFPRLEGAVFAQNSNGDLNSILEEEKNFAKQDREKFWVGILLTALLTLLIIWRAIYWLIAWYKYGKDPKLPEVNLSGKLHEPPSDLHPIYVQALVEKRVDGKAITATIIELVRRKVLKIERVKVKKFLGGFGDEFSLVLVGKNKGLNKYEESLINLLFSSSKIISFKDIRSLGRRQPSSVSSFWRKFKTAGDDLVDLGYLDKTASGLKRRLSVELALFLFAGFFSIWLIPLVSVLIMQFSLLLVFSLLPLLVLVFILLLVLLVSMDKRTEKGNQELASWLAFKRFLKDYSVTKNYPIDSVILWEKYLVYGTVLGISVKALSQLPIKYSEEFKKSPVFVGLGSSASGGLDFSSGFSSLGSALSSLSSSVSGAHGVGSSGRFSGGGGSGGGGGGGRAG